MTYLEQRSRHNDKNIQPICYSIEQVSKAVVIRCYMRTVHPQDNYTRIITNPPAACKARGCLKLCAHGVML